MRTLNARSRNKGLVALFAIASLSLVTANPALAVQTVTGTGAGDGWEYPQPNTGTCFSLPPLPPVPLMVPSDHFELSHVGTFDAADTSPLKKAVYVGPTDVVIDVAAHVFAPQGVGPDCVQSLGPVTVTGVTVSGTTGGVVPGNVSCTYNTGTAMGNGIWTRVVSAVNFTLPLTCTIQGNTGLASDTVTGVTTFLTITGTMNPCDLPPTFNNNNPECNPPIATRPANAGSHLITTYTAAGAP